MQTAATAATDDDGGDDYDDDGGAADLRASGGDGGRRYLVYQPMSGVAEWLLSLHNAAGLARALNRTLVVPPMLWEGRADAPVPYSALYDIGPLRALMESDAAGLVEAAAFARLRLPPPSAIALLHVKDPRLHPSRAYFDRALGWENATGVHLSAQMASAADYDRLYGMCDERILALSHAYAAFDGWADGSAEQVWFDGALARAVADLPPVSAAAAAVVNHLVKARGASTCLHLTDLDNAVLTARSPTAAHLGGGGRGAPRATMVVADPPPATATAAAPKRGGRAVRRVTSTWPRPRRAPSRTPASKAASRTSARARATTRRRPPGSAGRGCARRTTKGTRAASTTTSYSPTSRSMPMRSSSSSRMPAGPSPRR